MRILIVCSGTKNKLSPFIKEQMDSLKVNNIDLSLFQIKKKGPIGYLFSLKLLKNQIKTFKPDLIHAHYGLSGLFANLQRKVPVITTYHGSDINDKKTLLLSMISIILSKHNIFVSQSLKNVSKVKYGYSIIPCGIDLKIFKYIEKNEARKIMNLELSRKYVLFSGSFDNEIKNSILAQNAVKRMDNVTLIELKNYTRSEVNLLFNSVDVALLTSFSEGSSQFVKEAMACNCPVVSTNVADLILLFGDVPGFFLTDFTPDACAKQIEKALIFSIQEGMKSGRQRIIDLGLESSEVAKKII